MTAKNLPIVEATRVGRHLVWWCAWCRENHAILIRHHSRQCGASLFDARPCVCPIGWADGRWPTRCRRGSPFGAGYVVREIPTPHPTT